MLRVVLLLRTTVGVLLLLLSGVSAVALLLVSAVLAVLLRAIWVVGRLTRLSLLRLTRGASRDERLTLSWSELVRARVETSRWGWS